MMKNLTRSFTSSGRNLFEHFQGTLPIRTLLVHLCLVSCMPLNDLILPIVIPL